MAKEKTAKKKLIRIKAGKGILGIYDTKLSNTQKPCFALCGPEESITKDGLKRRTQISKFVTCREQLTEVPRVLIHKLESTSFTDSSKYLIDMQNYRLLIGVSKQVEWERTKQRLFSGKRALNLLEEAVGWTPSVITTVKHEDYKEDYIWLLTGDARWMKAPQMISLSCLILRIAFMQGPLNTDSLEELTDQFSSFAKTPENARTLDQIYLGTVRKHILPLMSNINEVFIGGSAQYYPKPGQSGWNGYGGVDTLIKCATGNENLHKRLKKYVFNAKK